MSSERVEFCDAELYLVGHRDMRALLSLEAEGNAYAQETGKENAKNPFRLVSNLINPLFPATKYTLFTRSTPRIITDPSKVYMAIEKEFSLWCNVETKNLNELIASDPDMTQERANRLREELSSKLEEEKARFDEVREDFEEYEVFVSNYENVREYPALYYSGVVQEKGAKKPKTKKANAHLSIRIPNVLWYEKNAMDVRSDATIMQKMKSGDFKRIGNTIYARRRDV